MYGTKSSFVNVASAVGVYEFAHQMQIFCITKVLDDVFEGVLKNVFSGTVNCDFESGVKISDRFILFEMYKKLNIQLRIDRCKKVIF